MIIRKLHSVTLCHIVPFLFFVGSQIVLNQAVANNGLSHFLGRFLSHFLGRSLFQNFHIFRTLRVYVFGIWHDVVHCYFV